MIHHRDRAREIFLPRTLPVRSIDDLTPYHFIERPEKPGVLSLRKGAPPKHVTAAAADYAAGRTTLNGFLDRIGVPRK